MQKMVGGQIVEMTPEEVEQFEESRKDPIDKIRDKKWKDIKIERSRRNYGGVYVDSKWFHTDEPTRAQYSIMLTTALEKEWASDYVIEANWKTMTGTYTPMTVAKLRAIRDAETANEKINFANAEVHRLTMLAASDPTDYDFSSGWCEIYGG